MELKEDEPGEFGFFPLKAHYPIGADQGPCVKGWSLLHWLLREHCCVKTFVLPRLIHSKFQGLLCDALHLNSGLRKLTLRNWQAKRAFKDVISAIGTLAQLEELDMKLVYLPPSALGGLGNALQRISTLKILTLPSLKMDVDNAVHLSSVTQFVKALKGCPKLAVLSSDNFVLEPASGEGFAEFVTGSSSLTKLSLCHSPRYHSKECALFMAVGKNRNLEELCLDGFMLYEQAERLLVEVAAQHTGLRYLEVGFYDGFREWEIDGTALADLVGRNTGLRELVFSGGTISCIPKFAEAIPKNTTMQKLTLGLLGMKVPNYRVFLQALARNQSLQLVTFKESSYYYFNDIVLLMRETGTEGRLAIDADVHDPQDFEKGLKNSTSLTRVAYSNREALGKTPPGAFRHLLHHRCLHELCIGLPHPIEMESATSLALLLSTTSSLRCATFEFLATASSSRILVEGLAGNTSLTDLSVSFWTIEAPEADLLWRMLRSNRTLKTLTLELLDFPQSPMLDSVPDGLLQNHYLLRAAIQQNPTQQSRDIYQDGIHRQVLKKLNVLSTQTFQFGVQELLRRNLSTLHRAVQFVTGSRGRRYAEAFERVSKGSTLLEALKKALAEPEDEIKGRIANSSRYLDEHFLVEAGVVRAAVVCGESNRVQLDRIGFDNWLCIRQYLKVTDIVPTPVGLLADPSSSGSLQD
uniref:Nlr family card domain protein n=1 Tax=Ixodes ricinus TaxID=34613 RepID=A0A6B0VFY2_IXORI